MRLDLEPRAQRSRLLEALAPLGALALAILIGGLVVALLGKSPLQAFRVYFIDPVSDGYGLQELAVTTRALGTVESEKLKMAVQWRQTIDLNWVRTRAAILEADPARIAGAVRDADIEHVDLAAKILVRHTIPKLEARFNLM